MIDDFFCILINTCHCCDMWHDEILNHTFAMDISKFIRMSWNYYIVVSNNFFHGPMLNSIGFRIEYNKICVSSQLYSKLHVWFLRSWMINQCRLYPIQDKAKIVWKTCLKIQKSWNIIILLNILFWGDFIVAITFYYEECPVDTLHQNIFFSFKMTSIALRYYDELFKCLTLLNECLIK